MSAVETMHGIVSAIVSFDCKVVFASGHGDHSVVAIVLSFEQGVY